MKRIAVGISLVLAVLISASFIGGQAQKTSEPTLPAGNGAPPLSNPLKVALLKWYPANLTTSVTVGNSPYGVAFDGENIWTANSGSSSVSKVRAGDCTVLGTFPVVDPMGVVFDGANIWASSYSGNSVTKLRASDGKNLGQFPVGKNPFWMAFDGKNLWVANSGDGTVSVLRASDGKNLNTVSTGGAIAAAFDGTYIWVTTYKTTVVRLRPDGSNAGTFTVGHNPLGIAFDGGNMWIANNNDNTVTKLRARDGATLGTFHTQGAPYGVLFDGSTIWVSLPDTGGLNELRPSDGTLLGFFSPPTTGLYSPTGVAFDGSSVWTANSQGDILSKL
jgi:hypothetical protein